MGSQRSLHSGRTMGHFPSLKMQRMVAFTSTIERDYLYLLDYSRDVLAFEERPLTIEYQYQAKMLQYTPSFSVRQTNKVVLVTCERQTHVGLEPHRCVLEAAKAWCMDQGYDFQVITDQDLRATPRIENIRLLTYYARHPVDPPRRARVFDILIRGQDRLTILQLASAIAPHNLASAIADIYSMTFHHEIFIQLDDRPLSRDALVGLPPQQSERSCLL